MISLKKSVNNLNNIPIVYLSETVPGEIYSIYKKLGKNGLGFNWYGKDKIWWIYDSNLNPEKISQIQNLGIDTSVLGNIPEQKPFEQKSEKEIPNKKENLTNKTDFETGNDPKTYKEYPSSKWLGFPVKRNIYTTEFDVNINDSIYTLKVIMNRMWNVLEGKLVRKLPRYVYNVFYNDQELGVTSEPAPSDWGTYDEDSIAKNIQTKIQNRLNEKEKSKMYVRFQNIKKLEKRDPKFIEFLKIWEDKKYDKEFNLEDYINQYIPERYITLNEGEYSGEFPINMNLLGGTIYLETGLDDPKAPYPKNLGSVLISAGIENIEQLNKLIDDEIQENLEEIKKYYLEYLKSFPFTKTEQEKSTADMGSIVNMIGNNFDVQFFKSKLINFGYIRPSKKVKRTEGGMAPQESVKYILDDKKIRNAVYSRNASHNPDFFYAVLAYYLMRKVRNITSWTEMMLVTNISDWVNLAKKYSHNVDFKTVDEYLGQLVNILFKELYGSNAPKSRVENFSDFYSGNWGSSESSKDIGNTEQKGFGPLQDFVNFVSGLGINPEEAKNNPKRIYRQLALKYHPDTTSEDKVKSEIIFKNLAELYKKIPNELKVAYNWYSRIV